MSRDVFLILQLGVLFGFPNLKGVKSIVEKFSLLFCFRSPHTLRWCLFYFLFVVFFWFTGCGFVFFFFSRGKFTGFALLY